MAKQKAAGVSKLSMVRSTITELGTDAMPKDIQASIKKQHGVELPINLVSNYKSYVLNELKKKGAGKKKMGRPPKAATVSAAAAAPVPTSNGKSGGITLDDIKAIKALAERLGSDKLKQLAEVLA